MLDHIRLEDLLCIDIETVPGHAEFAGVPDIFRDLYLKKSERLKQDGESEEDQYFNHAGIYAEFGKVICISLGVFMKDKETNEHHLRLKSIFSDDEREVLTAFGNLMIQHYNRPHYFQFCGHNIREFDVPFLCRRMLIQGLPLPAMLDISGKRPYEVNMLDTMQLWRFGDFKHFTSLKLMAAIFGLESPKDDIDGKDVGRVYWKEKDHMRIVRYCQKDVITVAQLILKFKGLPMLKPEQIHIAGS